MKETDPILNFDVQDDSPRRIADNVLEHYANRLIAHGFDEASVRAQVDGIYKEALELYPETNGMPFIREKVKQIQEYLQKA
jgi:hypothetical protein